MTAAAALRALGRAVRVLEIGSRIGFSTLTWAPALDECVSHKAMNRVRRAPFARDSL